MSWSHGFDELSRNSVHLSPGVVSHQGTPRAGEEVLLKYWATAKRRWQATAYVSTPSIGPPCSIHDRVCGV